ncbi:MAG: methyltransferase [Novosphingobium sp.]|nr:methyltransferase [Novosphingobium sp.]
MNAMHRLQVRDAFSAAQDYDRHARVQRVVARRLAQRIVELPLPARPRILEIGCGTGFLTEALIERNIDGEWLITDIAPAMVERCRARIGESENRRFALLDGEYGEPGEAEPFDLICSSLVMQWFDDSAAALSRMLSWLAPSGHCLFSTLAAGSFVEWRTAHDAEGLSCGTPRFCKAAELETMHSTARCGPLQIERLTEQHESAPNFLHSLKAIGAHTATAGHRPLAPTDLRRVMKRFEEQGASVTYETATGHFQHLPDREQ